MARRKSGKKIDFTRWTLGSFTSAALGAGSAQAVILSGSDNQSVTILRTRGELLCSVDGAQAPGGAVKVGVGFLLQQVGATATSLPLSDGEAPFFWYEVFTIRYEEMVTDVIAVQDGMSARKIIDSKAMRIVRPDQEVVCIVEQATIGAALSINTAVQARFLLGQ